MPISIDEVRHVARLARLNLDETELLSLQGELNALIGYFADIQDIDTDGVVPSSHAVAVQNIWSDDVILDSLPQAEALRNAPLSKAGLFVVPTIIEG
jgi:aspartyl-tRNA(Asn)/glutamyl-tRNA(Gln) amidotransferase subunit C